MTWNAFHSRGAILHAVIAAANERQDGLLPADVPGVGETFDGDLDLLSALMLRWHARLSGQIERALALEPMDLEHAVACAWYRANAELPGVRLIIDHYTNEPLDEVMAAALLRAQRRERMRLAAAAGASNDESSAAVRAGARVEDVARSLTSVPDLSDGVKSRRDEGTFFERLLAVLAA